MQYDAQRGSSGVAQHATEQNTISLGSNMCVGCRNIGAESLINPDTQSSWYWFSDDHALLQGVLCILVCNLVAVGLVKSKKVSHLVGTVRDTHVYVTLFFLLRQVVLRVCLEILRRCCQLDPTRTTKVTIACVKL